MMFQEGGPPIPEEGRQEVELGERQKVMETIYADMQEVGVFPARLIQGGKVIDLVIEENTGASPGRPFMIFEVAHPDPEIRYLIYKVRIEEDPDQGAKNETIFLERLAPWLMERMPPELAAKIRLPTLRASRQEGNNPFCLEEYLEGRIAGGIHDTNIEVLDTEDIDKIAEFIHFFQDNLSTDQVRSLAPEMNLPPMSIVERYSRYLTAAAEGVKAALGNDFYERVLSLLEEKREFLEQARLVFAAGDINPSNIIKTKDGQLGLVDWERVRLINSPVLDYDFMFVDLWNAPELQRRFFEHILELNQDDPDFRERMRLDFLFFRGTGELNYWWDQLEAAQTEEEKQTASKAVAIYSRMLQDAVEKRDFWATS